MPPLFASSLEMRMEMPERADGQNEKDRASRTFQFTLRTIMLVMLLCALALAGMRAFPKRAILICVCAAAIAEQWIERRLSSGKSREPILAIPERVVGVLAGILIGVAASLALNILAWNVIGAAADYRTAIELGAASGCVLGILFPRAFNAMAWVILTVV